MAIKKKMLSRYSKDEIVLLSIEDFAEMVKVEVKAFVNAKGVDDVDKSRIESRLMNAYSVVVHLNTEKRIIKDEFLKQKREYHRVETDALMVAGKELSVKATAREHKIYVHENHGDALNELQEMIDGLEQRWKLLSDHVDAVKSNVSTLQSVLASMRVEWEVSRA